MSLVVNPPFFIWTGFVACYGPVVATSSILRAFFSGAFVVFISCANPPIDRRPNNELAKRLPAAATSADRPSSTPIVAPLTETSKPDAPALETQVQSLEQGLVKRAVTDDKYAQRELYSWTTPDQASALRKTKTLLVATAKTRGAPSPYSRLLNRLAAGQGQSAEVAKLLVEHPGLTKRRYAWPSPFATSVPLGERSYGHVLVRIVLKNESFLAKLDPLEDEQFSFVDLNNAPVATSEVLLHPERIAAVFHVRRKPDGGPKFREYIVCNETMVARWSVGTAHEQTIVAEDAALIAALQSSSLGSALSIDTALDAASAWAKSVDKPSLLDAWRAAIAFDSPKYKPSRTTLEAIATSLAAYDPAGEAVDHIPAVAFPNKP